MNTREVAKVKMHNSFDTFLTTKSAIYAGYMAFLNARTEYNTLLATENNLSTALSIDNTVYSKEKLTAKTTMANMAADLAGFAQVRLNKIGKTLEAAQVYVASSDYLHQSDPEAKASAQSAHDLLQNVIADLSPDYVTATDLSELQNRIDAFSNIQGTSSNIHTGTPEQRKNFKAAVYAVDTAIVNIRLLAHKYRDSNPDFYSELIAQSTMPPVSVHHTTLSLVIKSKTDGSPIANATGTLSNSTKTGCSDANGFMTIEQVRNGNASLTVKAAGFSDYTILVNLISGHDNHFDILLPKFSTGFF